MADITQTVKDTSKKVYDTTMSYAQKIQAGILMPKVVWTRFNNLDQKLDEISKKLSESQKK